MTTSVLALIVWSVAYPSLLERTPSTVIVEGMSYVYYTMTCVSVKFMKWRCGLDFQIV